MMNLTCFVKRCSFWWSLTRCAPAVTTVFCCCALVCVVLLPSELHCRLTLVSNVSYSLTDTVSTLAWNLCTVTSHPWNFVVASSCKEILAFQLWVTTRHLNVCDICIDCSRTTMSSVKYLLSFAAMQNAVNRLLHTVFRCRNTFTLPLLSCFLALRCPPTGAWFGGSILAFAAGKHCAVIKMITRDQLLNHEFLSSSHVQYLISSVSEPVLAIWGGRSLKSIARMPSVSTF